MRPGPFAIALLLPLLSLWPLPLVGGAELLALPDQEASTHAWGLWAALREGSPLLLDTPLLAWPTGLRLPLVDPTHLLPFALGSALGGPILGYNAVLYFGMVVASLGGAALAGEVDGEPHIGALCGALTPALLANAADGQTEGFAVGWIALGLAALLRLRRSGRPRDGLFAALALAAGAYGGPYNGVWGALIGLSLLAGDWRKPARVGLTLLGAGLLTTPLAWALATARAAQLPGSADRAGLPALIEDASIYRGGLRYGADLLDLVIPGPLTGAEAPVSHTAYLGLVALLAALVALSRDRRLWPFFAGAIGFSALALGPYLSIGGAVARLGDRPLLAPAGGLILALPLLGRLTRWYRAGALASLLLAPLVSRAATRPLAQVALAAALLVDALALAPLAWPLHHRPPPHVGALADLPDAAVILELPLQTTAGGGPEAWRDQTGLRQTLHGHPVGSGMMGLPPSDLARQGQRAVEALLRGEASDLPDLGFTHLAIDPRLRPLPAEGRAHLDAALGPPIEDVPEQLLYALPGPTKAADDRPHR